MTYYTASTTPEAIYNAERSKQEATEFIERELKCPQCGFLIAYAFSDAKGHLKIKCKKCKKESVLNFAYFCKRKRKHRLYRVSNSRSKY